MGYFSNGTEGQSYEAQYCNRCAHEGPEDGPGCAVLLAHLLYNYDECNNENSILHILIPRSEDGLSNEECQMFIRKSQGEQGELFSGS